MLANIMLEAVIEMSGGLTELLLKTFNTRSLVSASFSLCVQRLRILQIILFISNKVANNFLVVLAAFGIFITSIGGFVMLVMREHLPIVLYIPCSTMFFVGQILNFFYYFTGWNITPERG